MHRRRYLETVAAGAALAGAGCTQLTGDSGTPDPNPNLKLPKPDELRAPPEKVRYPGWGQQLPAATLPAALRDTEVETTGFDTPIALTFIFTYCQTACPLLTEALKRGQDRAASEGFGDSVNFLELTFDPERDTPDRFREYADERSIDLEAGNWYFLRPPTVERAQSVITDQFGVYFDKTTPQEMDRYMFTHRSLILLVNSDGYVERTYSGGSEAARQLPDDLQRLHEA